MILTPQEMTGLSRSHVVQNDSPRFAAHPDAMAAFFRMREAAAADGIDLQPFSAFRDFRTQLRIWNKKYRGQKPLYDQNGVERDFAAMDEPALVAAILNWSAIPGGSRHQWGTEIDVVDGNATQPDYRVRLLPEETRPGGVYHHLHCWLDEHIHDFGFFRPYGVYQGGMYSEPWHLSYAPLSVPVMAELTPAVLADALRDASMDGKDYVLANLERLFEAHVTNVNPAPM